MASPTDPHVDFRQAHRGTSQSGLSLGAILFDVPSRTSYISDLHAQLVLTRSDGATPLRQARGVPTASPGSNNRVCVAILAAGLAVGAGARTVAAV